MIRITLFNVFNMFDLNIVRSVNAEKGHVYDSNIYIVFM